MPDEYGNPTDEEYEQIGRDAFEAAMGRDMDVPPVTPFSAGPTFDQPQPDATPVAPLPAQPPEQGGAPAAFTSGLGSFGYGLGPGNERTGQGVFGPDLPQEQRFGDASKWVMVPDSQDPTKQVAIPWAVAGAQPMVPMMQGVAGGNWGAPLDSFGPANRSGINIGAMASPVLDRMGQIAAGQKDQRWSPEFQKDYEQNWIEDARNNNLLAVNPERQADGSVGRVYTYESGRKAFEPYQAAPPAPRYGPPQGRPTNAPSGFSQNNREALAGFPSEIGGGAGGQWANPPGSGKPGGLLREYWTKGNEKGLYSINGNDIGQLPPSTKIQTFGNDPQRPVLTRIDYPDGRVEVYDAYGRLQERGNWNSQQGTTQPPATPAPKAPEQDPPGTLYKYDPVLGQMKAIPNGDGTYRRVAERGPEITLKGVMLEDWRK